MDSNVPNELREERELGFLSRGLRFLLSCHKAGLELA